jgi:hypothetical protein
VPGQRLGSASGAGRAPSGYRGCDFLIQAAAVRERLEETFVEDAVEGAEVNIDGVRSSASAAVGFGGLLPSLATDTQQTGRTRALLRSDVGLMCSVVVLLRLPSALLR